MGLLTKLGAGGALCLAAVAALADANDTSPDFSDVNDILQGQRHLLRNDDLLIAIDRQQSNLSRFHNTVLQTRNLRVNKQVDASVIDPNCLLKVAPDTSVPEYVTNAFQTRIGRVFALDRDVSVTLAPAEKTSGEGCPGLLALYVQDHVNAANNTHTVVENSGPLWTQLILADFDQDGFDDILQFHSSTPLSGGFAFHTAVDVYDPRRGLKRVTFRGIYPEFMPVTGNPVTGDFNADGAVDVMWLGGLAKDGADLHIYRMSVCPKAGVTIRGVQCTKAFQLIPGDTRDFSKHAIETGNQLAWPDVKCSGCPSSTRRYDLAAGNFDGRLSPTTGKVRDELVFVRANAYAPLMFEMLVYQFDDDLKPKGKPRVFDFSSSVTSNQQFVLASGPINAFGTTDQIALLNYSFQLVQLNIIQFDSGLKPQIRSMDVRRSGFFGNSASAGGEPFPRGVSIGRYDAPLEAATGSDLNAQIAALYDVRDFVNGKRRTVVQVYTIGNQVTDRPQLKSEHVLANQIFNTGVLVESAPIQSGDLQGRSLLLGEPSTFTVESHLQPSIILGSPPQHADYIKPIGESEPVVFNFSALKKDFHSTYAVNATTTNQSQSKTTTSSGWSVEEKSQIKGKTTFGPVEVEGELHQSLEFAAKNSVDKTFNTFSSKSFDASTATGFGDQVWYSSKRINMYVYPVIGKNYCPADKPKCSESEKVPLTATFSGPDNVISNVSAAGRTLEWYQPVHVPGQIFTYPWSDDQVLRQYPEMQGLSPTDTGAFYTDDSVRTTHLTWKQGSDQSKSVGFSSSWSLGGGFSVSGGTPESTYKDGGGIRASAGLDFSYSSGLSRLNTATHKVGSSSGISVKKPGTFPSATGYQFLVKPYIFGSAPPEGQSQNLKPDADILTHGPLRTLFAADPTAAASGSWWSSGDYRQYFDIGFGFPARWEIAGAAHPDLRDKQTACLGSECAVMNQPRPDDLWNSNFYWMRGFYIKAGNAGPQRVAATVGTKLELSARVYNHSFVNMPQDYQVRVRFYAQPWNANRNIPASANSFLVGEDVLAAIPGFAQTSESNWNLARTQFDTESCSPSCAGQYLVFWAVTWIQDGQGNIISGELPGHGLNQDVSAAQLKTLLAQENPSMQQALAVGGEQGLLESVSENPQAAMSFSNNVGFFHQVFYVKNQRPDRRLVSRKSVTKAVPIDEEEQGALRLQNMALSAAAVAEGGTVEMRAVLSAGQNGNDAVQVMVVSTAPEDGYSEILEHELIPHIAYGQEYQVRVPITLRHCGAQTISVIADSGEPGDQNNLTASAPITVHCR